MAESEVVSDDPGRASYLRTLLFLSRLLAACRRLVTHSKATPVACQRQYPSSLNVFAKPPLHVEIILIDRPGQTVGSDILKKLSLNIHL